MKRSEKLLQFIYHYEKSSAVVLCMEYHLYVNKVTNLREDFPELYALRSKRINSDQLWFPIFKRDLSCHITASQFKRAREYRIKKMYEAFRTILKNENQ